MIKYLSINVEVAEKTSTQKVFVTEKNYLSNILK